MQIQSKSILARQMMTRSDVSRTLHTHKRPQILLSNRVGSNQTHFLLKNLHKCFWRGFFPTPFGATIRGRIHIGGTPSSRVGLCHLVATPKGTETSPRGTCRAHNDSNHNGLCIAFSLRGWE